MRELARHGWVVGDDRRRDRLALSFIACLQSPNPELRDRLAFSGLQLWMRQKKVSPPVLLLIAKNLEHQLAEPDESGFARPFAALALAEVARADRLAPFLTNGERGDLYSAATKYLPSIRDYRGFDDREGWRHGVAHGADFILQLVLNPAVTNDQLRLLREAIETQIAPASHSYVYGEPQRLALPIFYMAQRDAFSAADWVGWLKRIASPAPLKSWNDAFDHSRDLSRLHNIRSFVTELYVAVTLNRNKSDDVLVRPLEDILVRLPA